MNCSFCSVVVHARVVFTAASLSSLCFHPLNTDLDKHIRPHHEACDAARRVLYRAFSEVTCESFEIRPSCRSNGSEFSSAKSTASAQLLLSQCSHFSSSCG